MIQNELLYWMIGVSFILSLLVNILLLYRLKIEKKSREQSLDEYECRICGEDASREEIYGHSCSNCMCSCNSKGQVWWMRKRTPFTK